MSVPPRRGHNDTIPPADIERPEPSPVEGLWVSDVVVEMLNRLEIPFIALNPGASYRGLHDSLVNRGGNLDPRILLCLHEEHAVAIAHGWAKVTERPMAAMVHANIGLMHATMAVFNAWCDRVPVLLLGATGPVDAAKRRPWIDWIHTAKDQGYLVRPYTKWDDQPASAAAIVESLLRATQIAGTAPKGPTYVCLDAGLQETAIETLPPVPDPARFRPPQIGVPSGAMIDACLDLLLRAKRPVILAGRVSRCEEAWARRVALAEMLGAVVLTDLKAPAAFPTTHPLHPAPAGSSLTPSATEMLKMSDVVLSLDWIDLAGTLAASGANASGAKVIQISVDQTVHNGWSMDHQGLPPTDVFLLSEPDDACELLLSAGQRRSQSERSRSVWRQDPSFLKASASTPPEPVEGPTITVPRLAAALRRAVSGEKVTLVRGPISWEGHFWDVEHSLDYLGIDGGGGLGSACGMAIGAALALCDSGRMVVSCFGDGEFTMGATALWTGVHYRVPLLIVVANNHSFYNDEMHQERVARQRGRLVDNKWIGQRVSDPDVDLAMLARAQGAVGIGPVSDPARLDAMLADAVASVRKGLLTVMDVTVDPGYDANTSRVMLEVSPSSGARV